MILRRGAPLLVVLLGCSSSSSPPLPPSSEIQALSRVTNLLFVPVDVAGTTGLLAVDTGDPFVLLSPTVFPEAPQVGSVSTLSVESDDLTNPQVITSSNVGTSPDPAVPLGGFLGCTVICSSVVSFNYRDAAFTIGSTGAPSGLEAETKLGFSFKGGMSLSVDGFTVTEPRSRIVVSVEIEGTSHTMILDTGASVVTVNADVFASLTADGRATLSGGMVQTSAGTSTASYTRAKSVSLGGAAVESVVVSHDPSFDNNLDAVSTDSGETIEGSLGGTFLNGFFVTIDYPNRALHLARYEDTSFIVDPAEVLGFALQAGDSGYAVTKVYPGTDAAAKGVTEGDAVVAIDGQTLGSITRSEVGILLAGTVGSTKSVQFGAASKLANQTVSIAVDNLLPLP
jgi:hypothetical protein